METYTPTNFRKQQGKIINHIVATKEPVELTINQKKDDGSANQGVVIIDKSEYERFKRLERAEMIRKMQSLIPEDKIKTIQTDEEFEKWWELDE